jgi:hypothetical protein
MAELPPELAPSGPVTQPGQEQSMTPISDVMQQGVGDATGDFITTLIRLMESKGFDLDDVMAEPSVEDQSDLADPNADPAELLTEEELIMLVQKFEALDPQVKQQLEQQFIAQLHPKFVQRLRAVQRFVQGGRR